MRIAVIGAGVLGAWCARFLADAKHTVTLIDAYGPANGRASSCDFSRVIRTGYGADDVYSRLAIESLRDWQWLAETTGQTLLARTGALFMGGADDPYVRDTYRTLTRLGRAAELLTSAEVHERYPQISVDGIDVAVLEHDAGVIRARAAVQALVALLVRDGAITYTSGRVASVDEARADCVVCLHNGTPVQADAFVFACGPWLPSLFPDAIGRRIRVTRQEVLYFGVPAGQPQFSAARLPVWIDFAAGLYGIPDLDANGFKIGVDRHGPSIDPDSLDRVIAPELVADTRAWMGRRFPGMQDAPLVDGRVCQYENTATGDFIIDRHPRWADCWIVGGGSGHGFKHGPAVGRLVAALVSGDAAPEARFALAGKSTDPARAVY
jgi:monomeric sarcosine oxidase